MKLTMTLMRKLSIIWTRPDLSEASPTISGMERFNDEYALTDWLHSEGITISTAVLPRGIWGLYEWERRRILIRAGMPAYYTFPALLHETEHHIQGHRGHQCAKIEKDINRRIAAKLINPTEYEYAESQYGWNTPGIASYLEVPRWVVQAYRDSLKYRTPVL